MVASFVTAAGFAPRLSAYGVDSTDLPWLVDAGLGSGRSTAGPIRLDPGTVLDRLSWELQGDEPRSGTSFPRPALRT
jgi:arylamine N-acetyltransferase